MRHTTKRMKPSAARDEHKTALIACCPCSSCAASPRVSPGFFRGLSASRFAAVEVREHEDVEELGAGGRIERVESIP
jgi:hypothetical protein